MFGCESTKTSLTFFTTDGWSGRSFSLSKKKAVDGNAFWHVEHRTSIWWRNWKRSEGNKADMERQMGMILDENRNLRRQPPKAEAR
uniref:Uncharacterized protein n=1 Tax=Panagrellus redivivus TaxID=6233 RepID=A0A7E4UWQ9_PANRE